GAGGRRGLGSTCRGGRRALPGGDRLTGRGDRPVVDAGPPPRRAACSPHTLVTMSPRRIPTLAIVADVVAVVVFAAIGRMSHARPDDLLGLLGTAAPFLVALVAVWAAPVVRANPVGLRAGLVVWGGTVALGLLLRFAFTGQFAPVMALIT